MSAGVELKNVTRKEPESRYLKAEGPPNTAAPPGNEYDIIKETARLRTTQRQQTENPLYGDRSTLPVLHPALTADRKKHESALSSARLIESESPTLYVKGKGTCGETRNCLVFVVLLFTLLVAIAALVLLILLLFIDPSAQTCSCPASATTGQLTGGNVTTPSNFSNATLIDYMMSIDELNSTAQQLSRMLDDFTSQVVQNQSAVSSKIGRLTAVGSMLNFSVCQNTQSDCSVQVNIINGSFNNNNLLLCTIPPSMLPPDVFTMNAFCAVTDTGGVNSPIAATLVGDPVNGYSCFCTLLKFGISTSTSIAGTFVCSLVVTTCSVTTNEFTVKV